MKINWTATAVLVGAAAISASVVLPERARRDALHTLQGTCWTSDIQNEAKGLAKKTMQEDFKAWMKLDDPRWTDDELDKITSIDLKNFYLVKVDLDSLHVRCGSTIDMSVTKEGGPRLRSTGNVLEFDVHPASPQTWSVTMASAAALRSAVESLKQVPEFKRAP